LKKPIKIISLSFLLLLTASIISFTTTQYSVEDKILAYTVDPKSNNLQLYWKNDDGEILNSIQHLKTYVEDKNSTLIFATNGGMFTDQFGPVGGFVYSRWKNNQKNKQVKRKRKFQLEAQWRILYYN